MDISRIQVIRESFGRVVYSHKTHEKQAEIWDFRETCTKWANIMLTTLTSTALVGTIITNERTLVYVSALLSALTLLFIISQLSFNPGENGERHRQVAKELWYIREKYVNLMADIINDRLTDDYIAKRRDDLTEELRLVYKFAPATSNKAYGKAQTALQIKEELTFSDDEIDQFLPNALKLSICRKQPDD